MQQVAGTAMTTEQPNVITKVWNESSHPFVLMAHFTFRIAALLIYLFGNWLLFDSFVVTVVITVVLLAIDFWVVKNVTGRLLVGRRWWSGTAPDGSTVWLYEIKTKNGYKPNPIDSKLFWASLYGATGLWSFFGLISLFNLSFSWLTVVLFALSLNLTNLTGYLRCDQQPNQQGKSPQSNMFTSLGSSIASSVISNKISAIISNPQPINV